MKEARAAAEALEKQLREFDEVAATAAAAAEAEHEKNKAHLQRHLEIQTDRLKKSDVALHASDSKFKAAEVSLRKSGADLDAATEGLATAQRDHASALGELTANSDHLLLLVEQLKESAAAASLESDQKQEAHQSALSSFRRQMDQLRSSQSATEEQRAYSPRRASAQSTA